jgi:hydroxypyruvate isomerase
MIPLVAKAGYQNLNCFSGNRNGIDDETGLQNCAAGLNQIMASAEKHQVIIVMELLNSRLDHPDYQCDKTPWVLSL